MWILALACRPDDLPTDREPTTTTPLPADPRLVGEPRILPGANDKVRLVHRLVAATDRPTTATLVLDDGVAAREISFSEPAMAFDLPLLALHPETSYTVSATFTGADGRAVGAELAFETALPHHPFPQVEVLVADLARMEPGYTVFPTEIDGPGVIFAVDAAGLPVWSFSQGPFDNRSLAFRDGVFTCLLGPRVLKLTAAGEVLGHWLEGGVPAPGEVPLPTGIHHEVAFEEDGSFWSFTKSVLELDYPTDCDDPSQTEVQSVATDSVVHLAPDGTLLEVFDLADRLDPSRVGYDSCVGAAGGGADWSHGNAIVPLADGSGLIVSLRNQDTVLKLSLPDGEVEWILANPDGWTPELDALRLAPVGPDTGGAPAGPDFGWQYHQHAPMVGPDGRLWLFDNGNGGRTTPYSQDPDPLGDWSRIAAFEIDEVARTARLAFTSTGAPYRLFSDVLGNADVLPQTGNVLATFGHLLEEDGIPNILTGRGLSSVRLIEIDPETDEAVFDLRLTVDAMLAPSGLLADRAIRVPTLYGPGVTERWLD